jgi:hypothetical protein
MRVRVCAFDFGNHYTGIVIADIVPIRKGDILKNDKFDIVFMDVCVDTSKDKNGLMSFLQTKVDPHLMGYTDTLIVYENNFLHRKENPQLIKLQTRVKKYYVDKNYKTKALLPSQKIKVSPGVNKKRKESAVECALSFLQESRYSMWLDKFKSYDRNHDIADALLMIRYIHGKAM